MEESDHTTSMDMVPEAALAVPNEEALAAERQVREDQIRYAEAAVSGSTMASGFFLFSAQTLRLSYIFGSSIF